MRRFLKITVYAVLICAALAGVWRTTLWVGKKECAAVFDSRSSVVTGTYVRGLHWLGFRSLWNPPSV
ncbi:MAG: hypothetical protein ACRCUT_05150, partial [Spirochaetota bacterium]